MAPSAAAQAAGVGRQQAFVAGKPWWTMPVDVVAQYFHTDVVRGLEPAEAIRRHAEYGFNELFGSSGPSAFHILMANIFNAMNIVLTIATIFSFVVGDIPVGVSLIVVMVINTGIGFYQEYKGEKTMEALKNMSSPISRILRHHDVEFIPTTEVVPGDVVYLEEGDICPADMRIIQAVNLELDEALLTGESLPVSKFDDVIVDETGVIGVGDRKNMAFMNTVVTKGRGHGIVVATSLCTEIGKIAESLSDDKKDEGPPPGVSPFWWKVQGFLGWHGKTPLQVTMDKLMYALLGVAIILGIIVFATAGFQFSQSLLLYAVSVGVAILPEGLPAVVTVTMSVGVARMAKQKAIVRRLNALEALGQVTNICSDKTGTLTEGKMVVTRFWAGGKEYDVDGKGLLPQGVIVPRGTSFDGPGISPQDLSQDEASYMMMLVCKKCTTCDLYQDEDGVWKGTGDPTEVALEVVARKALSPQDKFVSELEFIGEHPFDATIKRMTTVYYHRPTNMLYLFAKGAMERVLEISNTYQTSTGPVPVDGQIGPAAEARMLDMASDAMRVLGMAYKKTPLTVPLAEPIEQTMVGLGWDDRAVCEGGFTFLGVIGMFDPPRKETLPAVQVCHNAGITVHMATGDHPKTAEAVAKLVEIIPPGEQGLVLPASEFDKMTDPQVDALPELPNVLARCSPQTKVKMVDALHRREKFVAMTGDGSNDAPAIKKSDVGIAMGLGGSEVTKQVAAIVLTDDNFETIVNAVAEGRRIFLNITKFVVHLLSGNVAEVIALICGLAMRDYSGEAIFPMSPIEVLWLNMFTSSPVALCLGQEAADPDIMLRPPRTKGQGLFSKEVLWDTFVYGIFMGAVTLAAFIGVLYSEAVPSTLPHCNHYNPAPACYTVYRARGTAFTTLTFFLLVHGFNCRDSRRSMFNMRLYENKLLSWTVLITAVATVATLYIPFVNDQIFGQSGLSWQWGIVLGAQLLFVMFAELYKLWKRRSNFWNPPNSVHFGEGVEPEHPHDDEGFVDYTLERRSNMALDDQIRELEQHHIPVPPQMIELNQMHKKGFGFGFDGQGRVPGMASSTPTVPGYLAPPPLQSNASVKTV